MKVDMENIASPTLTNTRFEKGFVSKGKKLWATQE